jgi:hypothetical protein
LGLIHHEHRETPGEAPSDHRIAAKDLEAQEVGICLSCEALPREGLFVADARFVGQDACCGSVIVHMDDLPADVIREVIEVTAAPVAFVSTPGEPCYLRGQAVERRTGKPDRPAFGQEVAKPQEDLLVTEAVDGPEEVRVAKRALQAKVACEIVANLLPGDISERHGGYPGIQQWPGTEKVPQMGGNGECLPAAWACTNSDMAATADYSTLLFSWTSLVHLLPTE